MEVERLKLIKKYDEQDEIIKDKKIEGHHVIVSQMEAREKLRLE